MGLMLRELGEAITGAPSLHAVASRWNTGSSGDGDHLRSLRWQTTFFFLWTEAITGASLLENTGLSGGRNHQIFFSIWLGGSMYFLGGRLACHSGELRAHAEWTGVRLVLMRVESSEGRLRRKT